MPHEPDELFPELSTTSSSGLMLAHFEVKEVLGRGGFGLVVKAIDQRLLRPVAIKMLNADIAVVPEAKARFLKEARVAAAVRHENVVQIYSVENGPPPCLVMEYITGESLKQKIDREGKLAPLEVARLGAQIARGLAAAHAMKLIHRDVKPENILLQTDSDFPVRLTDFGLARELDAVPMTRSGQIMGTPMFMSPEQARGDGIDTRSDLFSLGSVLYNMTTGRLPFKLGKSVNVLRSVCNDTPRAINEIVPECPGWLVEIITKLMEKNPDDRYQSAKDVAKALEFGATAGQLLTPVIVNEPTSEAFPDVLDSKAVNPLPPEPTAFRWLPVLLLAVAVMLTVGFSISLILVLTKSDPVANSAKPTALPTRVIPSIPKGDTFKNGISMEFVKVPAGKAWLGGGNKRNPNREYSLAKEMYFGKFEVTQGEWLSLMKLNPSQCCRDGELADKVQMLSDEQIARLPVDSLTWNQADEFMSKLNKEHRVPGWKHRLPTTDEWEYACRGGPMEKPADGRFEFVFAKPTNTATKDDLNFRDTNLGRSNMVGSYPPNKLGLHDMQGNVFEFTSTAFGPNNESRYFCGGFWDDGLDICNPNFRSGITTDHAYGGAGIRLVLVRE